jgi:hypothetical protein
MPPSGFSFSAAVVVVSLSDGVECGGNSRATLSNVCPTDRAILEMLREGRYTPAYIAAERDYSRAHVRTVYND